MSKKTSASKAAQTDFEGALKELESLVELLESGNLGLTDSLSRFEKGVALSRECHELLEQARLKVTRLSNPDDPDSQQPFSENDSP